MKIVKCVKMKLIVFSLFLSFAACNCFINYSRRELNQFSNICDGKYLPTLQKAVYIDNNRDKLFLIPKFTKKKLTNHLNENLFLNVLINSTDANNLYMVQIRIDNKLYCEVIDTRNLTTTPDSNLNFSSYEFLLRKHDSEKALLLKILELRTGKKRIFLTNIPIIEIVENPLNWKAVIFVEFSQWKENSIQVLFISAPSYHEVEYYTVRLMQRNELVDEHLVHENQRYSINQIAFNQLRSGIDYSVVIDANCRFCSKSETASFRLPSLETERDPFNKAHTIVISCCIGLLVVAFLTALILSKKHILFKRRPNILVLYTNEQPRELNSFVNLLAQYRFEVTVDQLIKLEDDATELNKRISSAKFVVFVWHTNINSNIQYNNNLLQTLMKEKLVNTLWYDTQINHIPLEFRHIPSFNLPKDSYKLLHHLHSRKNEEDSPRTSVCSEKTKLSDSDYFEGLITSYDEDEEQNDIPTNLNTTMEFVFASEIPKTTKIIVPVVTDISVSGLDSNSSSIVLHGC